MAWVEAPETLTVSGVRYRKCADCYARVDSNDSVSIIMVDADKAPENSLICYREREGVEPVCASGRIYVNFEAGTKASLQTSVLEAAGYQIISIPAYAPHTAWVSRQDGNVAAALAGIAKLSAEPGIARSEPQLLGTRAQKGS